MTVSLWGDKRPEFITECTKSKDVPIFVVITGLIANLFLVLHSHFYTLEKCLPYYYLLLTVTSYLQYFCNQILAYFNLPSLLCILLHRSEVINGFVIVWTIQIINFFVILSSHFYNKFKFYLYCPTCKIPPTTQVNIYIFL